MSHPVRILLASRLDWPIDSKMLTLEIIVVFALFVLNGYFAMAELAIGLIIVPLMCHRKARRSNPFESRLVAVLPG